MNLSQLYSAHLITAHFLPYYPPELQLHEINKGSGISISISVFESVSRKRQIRKSDSTKMSKQGDGNAGDLRRRGQPKKRKQSSNDSSDEEGETEVRSKFILL